MTVVLCLAAAAGAWFYLRYRLRLWKATRDARRAIVAGQAAKEREAARRTPTQRLHAVLPDAALARLFRWTPERRIRPTVRIARRGLFGRYERIRPDQHIMVVGFTGSGKSSALRVLAAWALSNSSWSLEAWDGKWGASVRAYRGKCPVLDTMDAIEARLADLVARELPARALMAEPPHLAIIMDESRLLNELSAAGMRDLVTVIQTGRELGVHLWFGLQDPKTDSVPSEIRDQFSAKLVHQLQTREAAQVALKELVAAGWAPHRLMRSGQMLIWTPVRAMSAPRVVYGLWLSAGRLAALERQGPYVAPEFAPPVDLHKGVAPVAHAFDLGGPAQHATRNARTDEFAEAIERALLGGPAGVREIARATGRNPGSVHRKITQLAARGQVEATPDGFALPPAQEEGTSQ
ncbi:type IV secretory system conjugative DNA transfer family protein [Streptomyces sp. YU58]|uniref:type IV secretory system conjugative DNA transfer family protein n=1 Tax=Streptomyces sp. SX92 TaxID=3158972 RepID=UPI0027BAB1CC|nr:type IV secretory system conjugative DNA transfer family protein [Streptomyces coralus]WLW55574.1 type IV secretory system conjugative DNA transfer family protein [Streptomyces coralus]